MERIRYLPSGRVLTLVVLLSVIMIGLLAWALWLIAPGAHKAIVPDPAYGSTEYVTPATTLPEVSARQMFIYYQLGQVEKQLAELKADHARLLVLLLGTLVAAVANLGIFLMTHRNHGVIEVSRKGE